MTGKMSIDTREFQATLRSYMEYSKKDLADIINQKAFFIARRAARETFKARPSTIEHKWKEDVICRDGRTAPLGVVVSQKWAVQKYGRGFSPKDSATWPTFKDIYNKRLSVRKSACAYMAAGWKPAIKAFAAAIGKASNEALDKKGKNYKWDKMGGAKPANYSLHCVATLWNSALAKLTEDPAGKLNQFAGEALKRAFAFEVGKMREYIERKLQARANTVNTK